LSKTCHTALLPGPLKETNQTLRRAPPARGAPGALPSLPLPRRSSPRSVVLPCARTRSAGMEDDDARARLSRSLRPREARGGRRRQRWSSTASGLGVPWDRLPSERPRSHARLPRAPPQPRRTSRLLCSCSSLPLPILLLLRSFCSCSCSCSCSRSPPAPAAALAPLALASRPCPGRSALAPRAWVDRCVAGRGHRSRRLATWPRGRGHRSRRLRRWSRSRVAQRPLKDSRASRGCCALGESHGERDVGVGACASVLPFSLFESLFPSLPFYNSFAVVDRTRAHLISASRCAAAVTTRLACAIGTGLDIGGGRGRRVGLCPFGGWGEGGGHVFTCALRVRGRFVDPAGRCVDSWVRRLPSPPHAH